MNGQISARILERPGDTFEDLAASIPAEYRGVLLAAYMLATANGGRAAPRRTAGRPPLARKRRRA